MNDRSAGGFARWSQRKRAAREAARGGEAPAALKDAEDSVPRHESAPAPVAARADASEASPGHDRRAEHERDDAILQLTPIEDLTAESDYTQFLADGVPETLKRAALRKLWGSDPVLACLDGLNDYDEDFNVIDTAITAADTSYKVGRGFLDNEPEAEPATQVATAEPRQTESVQASADDSGVDRESDDASDESEQRAVEVAAEDNQAESTGDNAPQQSATDPVATDLAHAPENTDKHSKS